jgi:hypothetical protein
MGGHRVACGEAILLDLLSCAPDLSLRFVDAGLIISNRVAEGELEVAYAWYGVRTAHPISG